jgi:hypothetical protein
VTAYSRIVASLGFVETLECKRFVEFCEARRRDRYIGLCYGPPGVGKTLSAIHHSRIQKIVPLDRWDAEASDAKPIDTVLVTPEVVNTPSRIENDVRQARSLVCSVASERLAQNKGQGLTFCATATRLGVLNIAKTEITGPTILCPSSRHTTTRFTSTRPGSRLSQTLRL